jgi:hypothetical protein
MKWKGAYSAVIAVERKEDRKVIEVGEPGGGGDMIQE